jgi:hypothetical protein
VAYFELETQDSLDSNGWTVPLPGHWWVQLGAQASGVQLSTTLALVVSAKANSIARYSTQKVLQQVTHA